MHPLPRWLLACAAIALPVLAAAQATPSSKPIRLVVPYAAGGPADIAAREIAQRLAVEMKQPVIVDNQGGALGIPALTTVARAEPDGNTLLMPALGNVVLQPLLSKNGGAELIAKLRPVGMVSTGAHVLVVSAKLPVNSVGELVDYARKHPGQVSFASAGTGGTAHLAMEMFRMLSKTDVLHVPYKGTSAAQADLVSGQVSAIFSSLPSLQGIADKGYVRVLAATAPSTSSATRSLPLMSSALPGFEYTTWYAMYAPAATPDAVVQRLNAALRSVLKDPSLQARMEPQGTELLASTPEEVHAWVKRDTEKWGRIIREAHVTTD